eukprot:6180153-Pleurochrysis_carterae.AAC.1
MSAAWVAGRFARGALAPALPRQRALGRRCTRRRGRLESQRCRTGPPTTSPRPQAWNCVRERLALTTVNPFACASTSGWHIIATMQSISPLASRATKVAVGAASVRSVSRLAPATAVWAAAVQLAGVLPALSKPCASHPIGHGRAGTHGRRVRGADLRGRGSRLALAGLSGAIAARRPPPLRGNSALARARPWAESAKPALRTGEGGQSTRYGACPAARHRQNARRWRWRGACWLIAVLGGRGGSQPRM